MKKLNECEALMRHSFSDFMCENTESVINF